MACKLPPSQLTAFIAQQVAKAEAFVVGKVSEEVNKIKEKLSIDGEICPPVEELEKLLELRDNLLQVIDGFEKKITPIAETADKLDEPIEVAKISVTVLEQLTVPTTVGVPPPAGGVLISLPIKVTNKFSQLLALACDFVDALQADQKAVKALTSGAISKIDPIRSQLAAIDLQLEGCINKLPSADKARFSAFVTELGPQFDGITQYRSKSGNIYNIRIVEQPQENLSAPRRYALVENDSGTALLKGPASFSSSTKVLIDEIKFRIENQLP